MRKEARVECARFDKLNDGISVGAMNGLVFIKPLTRTKTRIILLVITIPR